MQKFNFELISDWKMYELILFNILQNAVKYNKPMDGDIIIVLSCKPQTHDYRDQSKSSEAFKYADNSQDQYDYVLETQIIDSGAGIS